MVYDFITLGGATRDISFFTTEGILVNNYRDILRQKLLAFEHGAKIKVDKFFYNFGGGATNAAVNLANFGLKTACVISLGQDQNGQLIIDNLKNRGVKTKLVQRNKGVDSGFSFILISASGERIIFTQRGANSNLQITNQELANFKKTKNIYIASLSGNWLKILQKVFSQVNQRGPRVFWNPGEAQYQMGLKKLAPFLEKTFVLAINKDEAIELVLSSTKYKKAKRSFLNDTRNLLQAIREFGPQIVMITSGKSGVDVYDGQKFYHQGIIKEKKRVDTTGVGDVFNSSFAAGLELFSDDINQAIKLGLRNTASMIAQLGAQNGLIKFKK